LHYKHTALVDMSICWNKKNYQKAGEVKLFPAGILMCSFSFPLRVFLKVVADLLKMASDQSDQWNSRQQYLCFLPSRCGASRPKAS
jgi:hypothetical protein